MLLILVLVLASAINSNAQKFRLGLKGSTLVGWIKPDTKDVDMEKIRVGTSYGATLEYNLTDNYVFSSGIDIINKSGSIEDTRDTTVIFTKTLYKIQQLQIPLTLKMKTNQMEKLTYFGQFGMGVEYRLKARSDIEVKDLGGNIRPEDNNEAKGDIMGLSASMIIGIGVEYSLGERTAAVIKLLFNKGFTDIAKDKTLKMSHTFLALNLGVLF